MEQGPPADFPRLISPSAKGRVHFNISMVKRHMLATRRVLFNESATLGVVAICEFLLVRIIKRGFLLTQAGRRVRIERRDVVSALQQDFVLFDWLKRPVLQLEEDAAPAHSKSSKKKKKKRKANVQGAEEEEEEEEDADPAPRVEMPKKKKKNSEEGINRDRVAPVVAATAAAAAAAANDDGADDMPELPDAEDEDEFAIDDTA
jgi:hypothetical protein